MVEDQSTFPKILQRIIKVANEEYDGKLFENVYAIFNSLPIKERKLILKKLVSFLFILYHDFVINEKGKVILRIVEDEVNNNNINKEIQDSESLNESELIKMKVWLVKASIKAAAGAAVVIMFLLLKLEENLILSTVKNLWEMIKFMWSA